MQIDWAAAKADATQLLIDTVFDRAQVGADTARLLIHLGASAEVVNQLAKIDVPLTLADAKLIYAAIVARDPAAGLAALQKLAGDLQSQLSA